MPSKSGFSRIAVPEGLAKLGVKKSTLQLVARKVVNELIQEQATKARTLEARSRRMSREIRKKQSFGDNLAKSLGVDVKPFREDAQRDIASDSEAVGRSRTKGHRKEPGHNPTRFPPYDWWFYSYNWWGVAPNYTFQPDTQSGGLTVDAGCLEPGGGVSGSCGVGMWYFATTSETIAVTAQSSLYGALEATAFTFPPFLWGYVSNRSALRILLSSSKVSIPPVGSSVSQAYYNNSGSDVFDFHVGFNGQSLNATQYFQVTAGTLYVIFAIHETSQWCSGLGGTRTNVGMMIDDFYYSPS